MVQLSYSLNRPVAYEGMLAYPYAEIYTAYNSSRQLVTVTVVDANDAETYAVTIDGVEYEITSGTGATATTIRDQLEAAIEAGTSPVTWTDSSTDAGLIESTDRYASLSISVASQTAGALTLSEVIGFGQAIPFGRFICWDSQGDADECRLPRASGDVDNGMFGIAFADSGLETVAGATSGQYPGQSAVGYVKKGLVWMISESAITTVGAPVYVRYAAGSGGSNLGAVRADGDTSTAAALTGASFRGLCSAGGLVLVEVNLPY